MFLKEGGVLQILLSGKGMAEVIYLGRERVCLGDCMVIIKWTSSKTVFKDYPKNLRVLPITAFRIDTKIYCMIQKNLSAKLF